MSTLIAISSHKEKKVTEYECILFFFLEMSSMVAKALNDCFWFLESVVSLALAEQGDAVWLDSFKHRGMFSALLKYSMKDRIKAYK